MVRSKCIKLLIEDWRLAKIASINCNMRLMDWIALAIREKIEREKGGKK